MALLNPGSEAFHPSLSAAAIPIDASGHIVEVWSHNLREEIVRLSTLVERYSVVAMDTEFPGVLYRLEGDCADLLYQSIRVNVNATKVIQIGISLSDEEGCAPPGASTWQFNLHFDLSSDDYAQDSIDLLTRAGLNFHDNARFGIDPLVFAEYFTVSGLVLNENVKWVTFHGGFDFGYFLRALTGKMLPDTESSFLQELRTYFPQYYDLKQFIRQNEHLKGGLSRLAEQLNVSRIGTAHQAGSDAVVTLACYFQLLRGYLDGEVPEEYECVLYGLGQGRLPWSATPSQESWRPHNAHVELSISN